MHHDLKVWPPYFARVSCGDKTFEVRRNDRDFQAGDTLDLHEFRPADPEVRGFTSTMGEFTGHLASFVISYVYAGPGLEDGYVVLALHKRERVPHDE